MEPKIRFNLHPAQVKAMISERAERALSEFHYATRHDQSSHGNWASDKVAVATYERLQVKATTGGWTGTDEEWAEYLDAVKKIRGVRVGKTLAKMWRPPGSPPLRVELLPTAKWGEGEPVTPTVKNEDWQEVGRPVSEGGKIGYETEEADRGEIHLPTLSPDDLINKDGKISPKKAEKLGKLRGLTREEMGPRGSNVSLTGTAEEKIQVELKSVVVSDADGNPIDVFSAHGSARSAQFGFDEAWQQRIFDVIENEVPLAVELREGSRWPNRIYVLKEAPHIAISVPVDYDRKGKVVTIFAENLLGDEWADTLDYGREVAKSIGSTLRLETLDEFKDRTGAERTRPTPPVLKSRGGNSQVRTQPVRNQTPRPQPRTNQSNQPRTQPQPQRRERRQYTLSQAKSTVRDLIRIRESGRTLSPGQAGLLKALQDQIRREEG